MSDNKVQPEQALDLHGARVLLVEDEYYIADDVCRTLIAAGAQIVGPVSSFDKAELAVEAGGFDCAVVDLNLHGLSALPIAERLLDEGKSFAITTGYGIESLPERLRCVPRIEKPFDPPALIQLVGQLRCTD